MFFWFCFVFILGVHIGVGVMALFQSVAPALMPKPEPRAKVKARADRQFAAARKRCREVVYLREFLRCERCRRQCSLDAPVWAANFPHVNENGAHGRGAAIRPIRRSLRAGLSRVSFT
jgi:hypothetical protein